MTMGGDIGGAGSALLTDLYQLNMMQAYLDNGQTQTATFELSVRSLPERRAFLLAAGLEQALDFLETLHFTAEEIDWLASTGRFRANLVDHLARLRFTGEVHAMPEGTVFFAGEPVLRITAPLPQAQLVETRLINILHFQTLIASKAARLVLAAPGKVLVDFGLRRAHEAQAGLMAARASYVAGFAGSAAVLAEQQFGVPCFGTMAHSYIESYAGEAQAFESFARSRPDNLTLLIDTYDTEAAAHKVVALAPGLAADGIRIASVRIDSGDLIALSRRVRQIFDEGGLHDVRIMVSGGLDEEAIAAMLAQAAPIDGFGLGTSLATSFDVPALDVTYKLQEYAGLPRRKRSAGKATWPGRKQVWRRLGPDGRMAGDVISVETDALDGAPLLEQVMQGGRRIGPLPSLSQIRARARSSLEHLPNELRRLSGSAPYSVKVAEPLEKLACEADRLLT